MKDLGVTLVASNSNGSQTLSFTEDNNEYWATLHGTIKVSTCK